MKVRITIAGYTPITWLCLGLISYSAWSVKNKVVDSSLNLVQRSQDRATAMHTAMQVSDLRDY